MTDLNGLLPIDKPEGPTSHDIVARARRSLRLRRIGHTGTLDPFASGLLLLCLGPSTRLAEYLTALPKTYEATLRLGFATDTDDLTGTPIAPIIDSPDVGRAALEAALASQTGEIQQVPPAYSAKKVGGERMYAAAREGRSVELEPVAVIVERLELLRFEPPEADLLVECSSGTYIRAIARDIGAQLGVGAHLTRLRRTRVGRFGVEEALTVEDLDDPAAVSAGLVPPTGAVDHLPRVELGPEETAAIRHGRPITADEPLAGEGSLALIGEHGELVAIGEAAERGLIRPRKVFA